MDLRFVLDENIIIWVKLIIGYWFLGVIFIKFICMVIYGIFIIIKEVRLGKY